ncbi:ATP-binding cassette domain-containing protein [Kribbella sp. NPDC051587]|uniref:AAA family ATPase n=1 Tax=Kribbella sp. NPDC051587 TaxID=3364119 RepID=UPI0037AC1C7D
MFVRRAYIPDHLQPDHGQLSRWPFTVPCVQQVVDEGLEFAAPVTFLMGDNGSGKSTLVEAIAEGFKLDPHGGRAAVKTARPEPVTTELGKVLRLDTTAAGSKMLGGPRVKKKGFFLRAETAFSMTENLGGVGGYWEADTSAMSHGEGFVTMIESMMNAPGFYVMDEPEAALSFSSCLHLISVLHRLGRTGAQVVCATHSPILAATPGADVVEVGPWGLRRVPWQDLDLVEHWSRFLKSPQAYLRHIIDDDIQGIS